ncbi:nitroreductase [Limosilactobacillus caviae]|uniref:Nitrobenzoate reductase n=1 Tax=Limosilactobacillus caviae TaxID=1769424 RepID=A0ABQ2C357_9LACO|nr:nitroreductase [Limosilactobacillus caviae]MCD7124797.1 nitroreductase [Limosilactobacillus caviae]MRH45560.1 hypothetical protein [Limosilactobacillus reuteri]GGI62312.1 nitrobenzoate reductase [Limosilactobacillus caviae]
MEFTETVFNRHATRHFTNQQLGQEQLISIINVAKQAPSWANDQPWKVVIATGKTLDKIKESHFNASNHNLPAHSAISPLHRTAMGLQGQKNAANQSKRLASFLGAQEKQVIDNSAHLFNAAAIVYLLVPKETSFWSAYDLGAFGQTLMLAAKDQRIDSMPAFEFVKYPNNLYSILKVNDDYQFAIGIGLGYQDKDALINHFRSTRMDPTEFLTIRN